MHDSIFFRNDKPVQPTDIAWCQFFAKEFLARDLPVNRCLASLPSPVYRTILEFKDLEDLFFFFFFLKNDLEDLFNRVKGSKALFLHYQISC